MKQKLEAEMGSVGIIRPVVVCVFIGVMGVGNWAFLNCFLPGVFAKSYCSAQLKG